MFLCTMDRTVKKVILFGGGFILLVYCFNLFLYYYSISDPISLHRLSYLEQQLEEKLYGQHIATNTVIKNLKRHFILPVKATALVIYGEEGTGKSHLVKILKDTHYNPANVHTFTPKDLPINSGQNIYRYRRELHEKIDNEIEIYPNSLFIFEHVENMSPMILNSLLSYLDYMYLGRNNNLRKPIFIFIYTKKTGSGSDMVMKKLYNDFYQSGNDRSSAKLSDFEEHVKRKLYNEQGGFYASILIQKNVTDHYIPFLPLERDHVKKCIRDSFISKGIHPHEDLIDEVLTHMTWTPEKEKVYAVGGCKGVNQKVILVKNKHNLQNN